MQSLHVAQVGHAALQDSQPANRGRRAIEQGSGRFDERLASCRSARATAVSAQPPQGRKTPRRAETVDAGIGGLADTAKLYSRTHTPGSSLTRSRSAGSHLAATRSIANRARTSGKSSQTSANSRSACKFADGCAVPAHNASRKALHELHAESNRQFERTKAFSGRSSRVRVHPQHRGAVSPHPACARPPAVHRSMAAGTSVWAATFS